MRLPWPFSRPQPPSAADARQVFAARPRGPQAWRDLPVLATSVGKPPLVAPTPPFREELAGAAAAPIVLAPLTHGRGLDAPAGLVGNVAAAAPARAATGADRDSLSAPLAVRHRQASAADAAPSVPEAVESLNVVGAPTVSAPSTEPALIPGLPERRAPVVDRSAPERPHRSLVSAAGEASLTLAPSGLIGASQGTGRPTPLPVTIAPETARATSPVVPAAAPPIAQALPRPASERLTLGQARRLGLGAPIDPVAFRSARTQPVPDLTLTAPAHKPASSASDAPPTPMATDGATPDAPVGDPAASDRLAAPSGAAPLAHFAPKPADSAPAIPAAPAAARSADVARSVQARAHVQRAPRAAAAAEMPSLPIVGARPIGPGIQLARTAARPASPGGSPSTSASVEAANAGGASGVRIHRGPEASNLAGALDARAFTRGSDIYLPESHGPLSGQKAQSLLAHELTHVAQQRRLGSSVPAEDSSHGQQLEAQAVAAERAGQLPLASPPDRGSQPAPSERQEPLPAALGFAAGSAPAASSAAPLTQRAPEAKFTDPDDAFRAKLDSNEEYLFGRFERRLRRQLIGERERGGSLIDAL